MAGRRRDNSIDNLDDDLRAEVRALLSRTSPRASYDQVIEFVRKRTDGAVVLTRSSLSRYWNNVLSAQLDEADRRTKGSLALARQVREAAQVHGQDPATMEGIIMSVLDGAFLAAETDPTSLDPGDMVKARTAMERTRLARRKLEVQEKALNVQTEKLQLEKERLQRELDKERAAAEERRRAADRAIADAEKTAGTDPERAALAAIRKSLGIDKAA
jgi:hypothetical protein